MLNRYRTFVLILFLVLSGATPSSFASLSLIYAVHSQASPYGLYPKGKPLPQPITEIWAFDVGSGKTKRIFSDAKSKYYLQTPIGSSDIPWDVIQVRNNKVFAVASLRPFKLNEPPKEYVFQLATDGSNSLTKLANVQGNRLADMAINHSGTTMAYVAGNLRKEAIVIQNLRTGAVTNHIPFPEVINKCLYCNPGRMYWYPDSSKLVTVFQSTDPDEGKKVDGYYVYIFKKDKWEKWPRQSELPLNFANNQSEYRVLVSIMSNERLLLASPGHFFVLGKDGKIEKKLLTTPSSDVGWLFYLSNDQNWVAYQISTDYNRKRYDHFLWIQNLVTGKETKVPMPPEQTRDVFHMTAIAGWLN